MNNTITHNTDAKYRENPHDPDTGDYRRLGTAVRAARHAYGYTNREHFAEACGVSVRLLSDLESGTRANFRTRLLDKVEAALDWPAGTMGSVLTDPSFRPPAPGSSVDMVFRPPVFNRNPVALEVTVVERALSALAKAKQESTQPLTATEQSLRLALVTVCGSYVKRLVEENCLPGKDMNPAVRPFLSTYTELAEWTGLADSTVGYLHWLGGDDPDASEAAQAMYTRRWAEARRARHTRGASAVTDEDHDPDPMDYVEPCIVEDDDVD